MFIFNIIAGILGGVAIFFVLCDIFRVPTYKTSRTMIGMEQHFIDREKKRINSAFERLAAWLSQHIKMRDFKRAEMAANLETARMNVTPEMFVASCIVKAFVVSLLAIPLIPFFPIGSLAVVIFAVIYYFLLLDELKKKVRTHRNAVELELVQMIFTIERVLQRSRNVVQILQNYREVAGPEIKQELDITLADMLSGNHEQAISRLEIRVGSVMMSDVCRGLISIMRGDDTTSYWASLQQKFSEHQRSLLRQKAERIPKRVNTLSMVLLFAFLGLWLGALLMQMADSFIEMFSAI